MLPSYDTAVACWNYNSGEIHALVLSIGDLVQVVKVEGEWCCGFRNDQRESVGIFPKSHVQFLGCSESGSSDNNSQDCVVRELSASLKEWWITCKQCYTERKLFQQQRVTLSMNELMNWRERLLSGCLPQEAIKDLKLKVCRKMDYVNSVLGMDMVLRDEEGVVINPELYNALFMYKQHVEAMKKIQEARISNMELEKSRCQSGSHCFLTTVTSFSTQLHVDAEVLLALYDCSSNQIFEAFTETVTFFWNGKLCSRRDSVSSQHSVFGIGFSGVDHKVAFCELSSKDLERSRILLICKVMRYGSLDSVNLDSTPSKKGHNHSSVVKQAYSVGAVDVTEIFHLPGAIDKDFQNFIPMTPCTDDYPDVVLKRLINANNRSSVPKAGLLLSPSSQSQTDSSALAQSKDGLAVNLRLIHGTLREAKLACPHLFGCRVAAVQKLGLPEVMQRGDRNDLYVTLVRGEFEKKKSIECRVSVVLKASDETDPNASMKATLLEAIAINSLDGMQLDRFYNSAVYRHSDKPQWHETVKIVTTYEQFKQAHVRFIFRLRSPNEAKDKAEKPFALAFLRLIQDNETVVKDGHHELFVYRINRPFEENELSYLDLPACRSEVEKSGYSAAGSKFCHDGFVCNLKEWFVVQTQTCSTKLTQNVELLGLLKWNTQPINIRKSLLMLLKADEEKCGEEVVKFLRDVLDALFNILINRSDYDQLAFDCLVYVISLVGERRYHNFKPDMDDYLTTFSAAPAYSKLITILGDYLVNVSQYQANLNNALKALDYLGKFIHRSWEVWCLLNGPAGKENLLSSLRSLFLAFSMLMQDKNPQMVLVITQGLALKYLPHAINSLAELMDNAELTKLLAQLLNNVPQRLLNQKLQCIKDIVRNYLFKRPDCRNPLLPTILGTVKTLLNSGLELNHCYSVLEEVLSVLRGDKVCYEHDQNLLLIMFTVLRPVVQTVVSLMDEEHKVPNVESPLKEKYVAILLAILDRLTNDQYVAYMKNFQTLQDLVDFMLELLMLIKDIVEKPAFKEDWLQMTLIQNRIFFNVLRFFAGTIKDNFGVRCSLPEFSFELIKVWTNFFHTAAAFCVQKHLQLENCSVAKCSDITRHKDLRVKCAKLVRSLWYSLQNKCKLYFIPDLVGTFLEISLLPQAKIREIIIPIFFDMIVAEHYGRQHSSGSGISSSSLEFDLTVFEKELATKLDLLIETEKGDSEFIEVFSKKIGDLAAVHAKTELRSSGERLIRTVKLLMTKLLEYREIKLKHYSPENEMAGVEKILKFYKSIRHTKLYLKYVEKLYDLHIASDNFVEAAYSLALFANELEWSNEPLRSEFNLSVLPRGQELIRTECNLKETLYETIIELFSQGQLWEAALPFAKNLEQHTAERHEYEKLARLLEKMAKIYRSIINENRSACEYFRVAFYGHGFPASLRNHEFIYRGERLERLADFQGRVVVQWPYAQVLKTLAPPNDSITESSNQYLQINRVDPLSDEKVVSCIRKISKQVLWYHKNNEIQKFSYTRHIPPPNGSSSSKSNVVNEFSEMWLEKTILVTEQPLPCALRWSSVVSKESLLMSPLKNAIEAMEKTESELATLISETEANQHQIFKQLQLKLKGVLDPAVMGGIAKYEQAFFTDQFCSKATTDELHNVEKLKQLIANQIPLLELGLYHHARKLTVSVANLVEIQFHESLVDCFVQLRADVEKKYGKRPSLLPPNASISMPTSQPSLQKLRKHDFVDTFSSKDDVRFSSASNAVNGSDLRVAFRNPLVSAASVAASFTLPKTTIKRRSNNNDKDVVNLLAHRDSNVSIASQNSEGSAAGLIELTENLSPRRPPRPDITAAAKRRSASIHSLTRNQANSVVDVNGASMCINSAEPFSRINLDACSTLAAPPVPPRDHRFVRRSSESVSANQNNDFLRWPSQNGDIVSPPPPPRESRGIWTKKEKPPPPLPLP